MLKRFMAALMVTGVLSVGFIPKVQAQAGQNAIAFCVFNPSVFLGPLAPTADGTGWNWYLWCAINSNPGVITPVNAITLNGDNLAAVGQKLANAVKAQVSAAWGINITNVLLPSMSIVTPQ